MKTTADFIDALRVKFNVPSDYALAGKLGMQRQHISRYRTLTHTFDDAMSLRVAELLEMDGSYVMACMNYQRAKLPAVKAAWNHAAKLLGGLAAALAILAILPYHGTHDNASSAFLVGLMAGDHCILCQTAPGPRFFTLLLLVIMATLFKGRNHDLQQ